MPAKAFNPTSSPLVLDDGSVLPGGEHGEVDTASDRVLDAVADGRLVLTHQATHERALAHAVTRRAERAASLLEGDEEPTERVESETPPAPSGAA